LCRTKTIKLQLSFILRKDKTNKAGLAPVRMLITLNGTRVRKNVSNVKCSIKDWKNQRVKPNLKKEPYNYHIEYNKELDEIDTKVKLIYRHALLNEITLTDEYVLEKLNDSNFSTKDVAHNFFDSFKEFIDTNKSAKAEGTTKKYTSTLNFLKDFSNDTDYNIRFDNLNADFYEKFRDYAFEKRNTLNNYFGKLIAGAKTFLTWAHERGYHKNLEYKLFKT
jgi:hypothetical protein